jgi:hypothetical protein
MAIGGLFILIAGSIFVTSAWKYLPAIAKQCCLLLVSIGLFTGSYFAGRTGKLNTSANLLYELGAAFIGFFIITITGGMNAIDYTMCRPEDNARILIAITAMLILIGARWIVKKSVQDFSFSILLSDVALACVGSMTEHSFNVFVLLLAVSLVLQSAFNSYTTENSSVDPVMAKAILISYRAHGIVFGIFIFFIWLFGAKYIIAIYALALTATSISYSTRPSRMLRLLQSLLIPLTIGVVISKVFLLLPFKASDMTISFIIFVITLIAMIWLMRLELMWIAVVYTFLLQTSQCLMMISLEGPRVISVDALLPFSLVLSLALMILSLRRRLIIFRRMAIIQLFTGIVMAVIGAVAVVNGGIDLSVSGIISILRFGVILWTIAEAIPCRSLSQMRIKQSFWTLALFSGIYSLVSLGKMLLPIPAQYSGEYACLIYAAGIVLLKFIWYDIQEVRVAQFVMTCILLALLLISDAFRGGLGNVLIYGAACVGIILIAAIRNSREYVIAASVALAMLVIYITRAFWLSIAWWIYLFAAGVVLIVFAVIKERKA